VAELRKWSKLAVVKQRCKHAGTTDSDRLDDVKMAQVAELTLCDKARKEQIIGKWLGNV
jgi:hypothetical protein